MKLQFGPFEFDPGTRELRRAGAPVHLSPKSFDLLQILIERRPALDCHDTALLTGRPRRN